jgi:flagellin
MSNDLLNMALQLSVQDMFSSSWFSSALMNKVWMETMRSSVNGLIRKTGGSDLLGAALGGSLRGDAAMLRQASSNVSEAHAMMNMAATAAGNIAGQLKEAQGLAHDFLALAPSAQNNPAIQAQYKTQYEAISKNIDSIIQNTRYNGIALLDGSAWSNGDERLTVTRDASDNPVAASVHIQAGDSGFPLSFSDMAKDFSNIFGKHSPDNPSTALAELSSLQRSAQTLADLYAGRAGSLQSQAVSLRSQADILEEAAALRAKTPTPVSTENLLLNLILRDGGGLFSGRG